MATSVSQILGKTSASMRQRIGPLLGLWGTFFVAQIVITFVFGGAIMTSASSGLASGNFGAMGMGVLATAFLFYLVYFMLYFAQSAALISMASPLREVTFGEAITGGLRSAPSMLGAMVILLIIYFLGALVFGLVIGMLSMLGSVVTVVGGLLILPFVVYLICRISVLSAVIPVERVWNPITAITRAWALTRGNALTVFLVLAIFVAITVLLFGAMFLPVYSSIGDSTATGQMPNLGSFGFLVIGIIAVSVLMSIVFAALFAAIHSELAGTSGNDFEGVFA